MKSREESESDDIEDEEDSDDSIEMEPERPFKGMTMDDAISQLLRKGETSEIIQTLDQKEKAKVDQIEKERKERRKLQLQQKEVQERGHVKLQVPWDAKEKQLSRVATRGVVRLFNAVAKEQKKEEPKKMGFYERKRQRKQPIAKESFLDILKKGKVEKAGKGAKWLSKDVQVEEDEIEIE